MKGNLGCLSRHCSVPVRNSEFKEEAMKVSGLCSYDYMTQKVCLAVILILIRIMLICATTIQELCAMARP